MHARISCSRAALHLQQHSQQHSREFARKHDHAWDGISSAHCWRGSSPDGCDATVAARGADRTFAGLSALSSVVTPLPFFLMTLLAIHTN